MYPNKYSTLIILSGLYYYLHTTTYYKIKKIIAFLWFVRFRKIYLNKIKNKIQVKYKICLTWHLYSDRILLLFPSVKLSSVCKKNSSFFGWVNGKFQGLYISGATDIIALKNQTEHIIVVTEVADRNCRYSNARVMLKYRSNEIKVMFRMDAVHKRMSVAE